MNVVSVKIKTDKILYKVKSKVSTYTRVVNKTRIIDSLNKLKQDLINNFLQHPVTRELMQGELGSNSSGTLGGYGNLFSFIGFDQGYDPIQPILNLFNSIDFQIISLEQSVKIAVLNFPTQDDVWDVTPMPWMDGQRSWARGIESGISGLNYYVFYKRELESEKSRSKHGLQIDSETYRKNLTSRLDKKTTSFRLMRYTPTSYITEILKDFKSRYKRFLSRENKKTLLSLTGII